MTPRERLTAVYHGQLADRVPWAPIISQPTLSAYPEGVMFAVLLMNALVPLINRSTIPRPVGGPVPQPRAKE